MSAFGPWQASLAAPHMSAFGGKADMTFCGISLSRSLLGVERTWRFAVRTSAFNPKRQSGRTDDGEKLRDSDWCIHAAGSVATLSISGRFGPRYLDPPDRPG